MYVCTSINECANHSITNNTYIYSEIRKKKQIIHQQQKQYSQTYIYYISPNDYDNNNKNKIKFVKHHPFLKYHHHHLCSYFLVI